MKHDGFHLAQINIATLIAPLDDPKISGFVKGLDRINHLAEASDGFVWRLKEEDSDNATGLSPYEDPLIIVNMSVWTDVDSLKLFAYHSDHLALYMNRKKWFHPPTGAHMALWWVPIGHEPTIEEGADRLEYLDDHEASLHAFGFRKIFYPGTEGS